MKAGDYLRISEVYSWIAKRIEPPKVVFLNIVSHQNFIWDHLYFPDFLSSFSELTGDITLILVEFLEVAITSIVCLKGVYPNGEIKMYRERVTMSVFFLVLLELKPVTFRGI